MKTNLSALPCPFCGRAAKIQFFKAGSGAPELEEAWWTASCSGNNPKTYSCSAAISVFGDTKAEATEKWNRRTMALPGESNARDAARRTLQPMVWREDGTVIFKPNAIVDFLKQNGGYDMNALARMNFTDEDRAQFAQLIGYTVGGFGELSYVPLNWARHADTVADRFILLRKITARKRPAKKGRPS